MFCQIFCIDLFIRYGGVLLYCQLNIGFYITVIIENIRATLRAKSSLAIFQKLEPSFTIYALFLLPFDINKQATLFADLPHPLADYHLFSSQVPIPIRQSSSPVADQKCAPAGWL